ncbi:peptidase S8/S53 domain-containing protein [Mycena alexandri]|uniref:Peptidase S8/S53 domain-containing protein n=1 Tax=Mycena alexandri TaxID=1745969 RepID=A0AAD6SS98_9AGAR|nr:peptidase S8/S53 domain-containing protein [Mycena alexandri]
MPSKGKGCYVYVIDTGCDSVEAGKFIANDRITYIPNLDSTKDETHEKHGTSVAVLVGGIEKPESAAKFGSGTPPVFKGKTGTVAPDPGSEAFRAAPASNCNLVILRYNSSAKSSASNPVVEDLPPAVINCSFSICSNALDQGKEKDQMDKLAGLIKSIRDAGIIVVAAAGNHRGNVDNTIYKAPSVRTEGEKKDYNAMDIPFARLWVPPCFEGVITVGALDQKGGKWVDSASVKFWLLGDNVVNPLKPAVPLQGTSFAAPMLSGIIACILTSSAQ